MHRTQLMLEEWQHEALRSLAERRGCSLSAVLRAILAEHLDSRREPVGEDPLAGVAGLVNEPGTSGAAHDDALYGPERPLPGAARRPKRRPGKAG